MSYVIFVSKNILNRSLYGFFFYFAWDAVIPFRFLERFFWTILLHSESSPGINKNKKEN